VVKAEPDGYTLLITTGSQAAVPTCARTRPMTRSRTLPYRGYRRYTLFLFVNPQLPAKNLQELIAYAKANPDMLNYATSSVKQHRCHDANALARQCEDDGGALQERAAGHARPRGGRVQVFWDPPTTGLPFVKDGRVRVLATAHSVRSSLLPDVPL